MKKEQGNEEAIGHSDIKSLTAISIGAGLSGGIGMYFIAATGDAVAIREGFDMVFFQLGLIMLALYQGPIIYQAMKTDLSIYSLSEGSRLFRLFNLGSLTAMALAVLTVISTCIALFTSPGIAALITGVMGGLFSAACGATLFAQAHLFMLIDQEGQIYKH